MHSEQEARSAILLQEAHLKAKDVGFWQRIFQTKHDAEVESEKAGS